MKRLSESEHTPLLPSLHFVASTTATPQTARTNDMSSAVKDNDVTGKANATGLATNAAAGSSTVGSTGEGVYDGDALDDAILRAQGHEASMPRAFSILSSLGLAFSITNSWIGYLSTFGQNLIYGGPQSVVFGLLVATAVQWTITLGLSELASAFPSTGGQYHFVFILAPEKHKRFAAFIVGWMSMLAWWIVTSSGLSLAAASVLGMVKFWNDAWVITMWQVYFVYAGIAIATVLPLFACPKQIPRIVQLTLLTSILGFIVTFIILLATHKQKQPGSFITQPGLGTSGWGDKTAWVLGITNAMYAYGGTDGPMHIAEEMRRPGKRLPQIMNLTIFMGLVTTLPLMVIMMLFMKDIESVVASALPSAEVFYQITESKTITTFLMAWLIICYIVAIPSQWVTSGRIAWAFARDNGLPFSAYFSHVDKQLNFPVRTTLAAVIFVILYGLLYLVSTTAFNSIITSAVLYLNLTYAIPQAIVLVRGRTTSLPPRYLNLGRLGYFCNGFATLWVVVLGVLVSFPPTLPVTVATMNYSSVVLVGLFGVVICFWLTIGKKFEGPKIDWEELNAPNLAAAGDAHVDVLKSETRITVGQKL